MKGMSEVTRRDDKIIGIGLVSGVTLAESERQNAIV